MVRAHRDEHAGAASPGFRRTQAGDVSQAEGLIPGDDGRTLPGDGSRVPRELLSRIWRYEHIDEATQVLLEDLTVAILFVRLASAIGNGRATVVVAVLFAAGHVPVMVSQGATWSEMGGLARDAVLGAAAILVLQRSRDVLWFWPVHFSLDMTQFPAVCGVG